jgi:hypothetical protein
MFPRWRRVYEQPVVLTCGGLFQDDWQELGMQVVEKQDRTGRVRAFLLRLDGRRTKVDVAFTGYKE